MNFLVRFLTYCVPHFRTIYYLAGTDEAGKKVCVVLNGPDDMEEDAHHLISCCHVFILFGRPLFPRYYAYQPE